MDGYRMAGTFLGGEVGSNLMMNSLSF
jgi:hypothetical protein